MDSLPAAKSKHGLERFMKSDKEGEGARDACEKRLHQGKRKGVSNQMQHGITITLRHRIVILNKTIRIMKQIDQIVDFGTTWPIE